MNLPSPRPFTWAFHQDLSPGPFPWTLTFSCGLQARFKSRQAGMGECMATFGSTDPGQARIRGPLGLYRKGPPATVRVCSSIKGPLISNHGSNHQAKQKLPPHACHDLIAHHIHPPTSAMHLMYTLNTDGKRVYTLHKVLESGEVTKSAHPGMYTHPHALHPHTLCPTHVLPCVSCSYGSAWADFFGSCARVACGVQDMLLIVFGRQRVNLRFIFFAIQHM